MLRGEAIAHPHPLIIIYLGAARWSNPGQKILPWSGGWLDWDLHEVKGMELLEELIETTKDMNERRANARSEATGFFGNAPGE